MPWLLHAGAGFERAAPEPAPRGRGVHTRCGPFDAGTVREVAATLASQALPPVSACEQREGECLSPRLWLR